MRILDRHRIALRFALGAALLALAAGSAGAAPATKQAPVRLAKYLKGYLQKNNLPKDGAVRTVKIDLPGRKVTRIFVPVLPETRADFEQRFSAKNGAILWRQSQSTNYYASLQLKPGSELFRTKKDIGNGTREWTVTRYKKGQIPGEFYAGHNYLVPLALGRSEIAGLEQFYRKNPNPTAWQANNPGKQIYCNNGGCMWWLAHAETGNNTPLPHLLGVSRSGAPENLFKKILHAGNHRVGPIGVVVNSLEEFRAKTDADLMGTPPVAGAMEAMHQ